MKNLTDPSAVDGLMAAIDQWQVVTENYKNAEQGAADSQKTLESAQQKLDAQSQKITGDLAGEVGKEIDQKVKDSMALKEYLSAMTLMQFEEVLRHYPQLQSAQLCYQVFPGWYGLLAPAGIL